MPTERTGEPLPGATYHGFSGPTAEPVAPPPAGGPTPAARRLHTVTAIPRNATIPIAANETVVGHTPLPVFAIHGENDEVFSIDAVRAAVEALARDGQDVTFAVKYRGTHMAPCSYVAELRAASLWLSTHAFR